MLVSLLLLLISTVSESANILVLHPIYCGSHEFILRKMGDQLVARGHEVTQVHKIKSKFLHMFAILVFLADIQSWSKLYIRLLNKPYLNEDYLTEQNLT